MEQKDMNVYDIFGEIKNTNNGDNIPNNINNDDVNNNLEDTVVDNSNNYLDDDYLIEQKIQELLGDSYKSPYNNDNGDNKYDSFNMDEINVKENESIDNSVVSKVEENSNSDKIEIIDFQQSPENNSFNSVNYYDELDQYNNSDSFVVDESIKFNEYPKNEMNEPSYEELKEDNFIQNTNEQLNEDLNTTYLNDDGTVETVQDSVKEEVKNEDDKVNETIVDNNVVDNDKKTGNGFIIFVFILMALTIIFLPYIYELLK